MREPYVDGSTIPWGHENAQDYISYIVNQYWTPDRLFMAMWCELLKLKQGLIEGAIPFLQLSASLNLRAYKECMIEGITVHE